ncbi:MAG: hypothetical protein ABJE47_12805 [bacterium]
MDIATSRKRQLLTGLVLLAAAGITWAVLGRGPITASRGGLFLGVAIVLFVLVALVMRRAASTNHP